jgi:glycosyltransferase involved in cell wall biosynthesis
MNKKISINDKVLIIIPTHNDERIISNTVSCVESWIKNKFSELKNYKIAVIENGSFDNTKRICKELSKKYTNVSFSYLNQKGRGHALRYAMTKYNADIYCYMDSDLSTEISSLKKLIEKAHHYDIVIGTRYHPLSKIRRSFYRLILSRVYNILVQFFFKLNFSDFQCGFKAFNKKTIINILPQIQDTHWFFDTEFLIIAYKNKYKIYELPIKWEESKNSSVKPIRDTIYHLIKLFELKIKLLPHEK